MNFLNLDLDFFINEIAQFRGKGDGRLSPTYKPWTRRKVRQFLEDQCGLSTKNPIPGRFVSHHDGAFDYWRDLVGDLENPLTIDLVHVDAHSDLGLGDGGWKYLMEDVLHWPIKDRSTARRSGANGLNLANYLAFAVACRWIKSITFVLHPKWPGDLMWLHFKNFDTNSGLIELKCYMPDTIDVSRMNLDQIKSLPPVRTEPSIPFTKVPLPSFRHTDGFDSALLCHSPDYTPRAADNLISVFADYIDFR